MWQTKLATRQLLTAHHRIVSYRTCPIYNIETKQYTIVHTSRTGNVFALVEFRPGGGNNVSCNREENKKLCCRKEAARCFVSVLLQYKTSSAVFYY